MNRKIIGLTAMLAVVFILRMPTAGSSHKAFHSPEDIRFFNAHILTPIDSNAYFLIPKNCRGCHGFDSLGLANVDGSGVDINLYDDWETSMMGLSATDPFWKAKVSHEILIDSSHSNQLQTICTTCHAPLGHYTALYKNQPFYTINNLSVDSLGQSGVSCMSCHAMKDSSILGTVFNGVLPYDTLHHEYGPFTLPNQGPMQLYVGLTPYYGSHLGEARACSPCHTLISNSSDLNGNPTGTTFVEQATFQEYQNSIYPSQLITCQSCHMPVVEDPVKIANGYLALPGRAPYNQHVFVGGNSFMVNLIKNNKSGLGINAQDKNFDSTLAAITRILRTQTVDVITHHDSTSMDTVYFSVKILNKAGHKFPSGYPSRRAFLRFIVLKQNGDTLFVSGNVNAADEIIHVATPFEQHHDIIKNSSQTQIYEMIMGDLNGNVTSVLARGYSHLKDNRIPPQGYSSQFVSHDTTEIVGVDSSDIDFNLNNGVEGTGYDIVHYHVPFGSYSGNVNVTSSVYYQSIPASFLNEMQLLSSPAIDSFLTMFSAANNHTVLVGGDTLPTVTIPVGIAAAKKATINIGPNPTFNGMIYISGINKAATFKIYSSAGNEILFNTFEHGDKCAIRLPESAGIYYIVITDHQQRIIKKIVRY